MKLRNREWLYPKSAAVLKAAGLYTINHCIGVQRNTVAKYIVHRSIFEMVSNTKRLTGTPPRQVWWDQDLDLTAAYEAPTSSSEHSTTHTLNAPHHGRITKMRQYVWRRGVLWGNHRGGLPREGREGTGGRRSAIYFASNIGMN